MPELPEVQTVVDDLLAAGLAGKMITGAQVFWPRIIQTPSVRLFCRNISGKTIDHIRRRAKYIVFDLSGGWTLLIHLRMTGRLHLVDPGVPVDKHEHAYLQLGYDLQLRFHDTRKFGRLYLVKDERDILGKLGPEPLGDTFTAAKLYKILQSHSRMLKPLLLDQTVLAGLGNIYVDEALWDAHLHPCCISSVVSRKNVVRLHRAIRKVLKRGLKNMGTTLGTGHANFYSVGSRSGRNRDRLNVFRRTGRPCPRCKTSIERITVSQRSTHICPACQKHSPLIKGDRGLF
jgi:formamidopyrimidine-DNA glycosylase